MLRVMTVTTGGLSANPLWGQNKAHAATRNIVPAHRLPAAVLIENIVYSSWTECAPRAARPSFAKADESRMKL
jgi:TPP-dependent pyruvate/acetoin dehydrogenase alpha subunit